MSLSLRAKRRQLRNKVQWQGAPRLKLLLSVLVHFSCRARLRRGPPGSLRALQHSLRVRTVSRNLPKCVNITFWTTLRPVFLKICGQSAGAESSIWSETQARPPAYLRCEEASGKLKRGDSVKWIQMSATIDTSSPPVCRAPGRT